MEERASRAKGGGGWEGGRVVCRGGWGVRWRERMKKELWCE